MKARSNPNIASALTSMAQSMPDETAIYYPKSRSPDGTWHYDSMTYGELDSESTRLAAGLGEVGITAGTRAVLMVKPSMEFFALTFALFKAAIVPVMVDPGMGIKNLKTCLQEAQPQAFIGIPKAHVARILLRWGSETIEHKVTVGRRWFWGGFTLDQVREKGEAIDFQAPGVDPSDTAALLFTSGSTGVPKGAVYNHGNFSAQVDAIRATYDITPGEIDLPTFPLFALFDPALGMTTVLPQMDFANPATVNPRNLVEPIRQFGITNMFGSPAVLERLGRYGEKNEVVLPSLKRVISAGAPVPSKTLKRVSAMLEGEAEIFTPYGATECLPVASMGSREILSTTAEKTDQGAGVCIGRPVEGMEVKIIEIVDDPIEEWSEELEIAQGQVGEFVVKGEQATRRYFNRDEATRRAKIKDGEEIRHRMGDLGYFDDEGRMWFCGRKSHRVELGDGTTMFTIQCEGVFNTHPEVFRTALVGVKKAGEVIPVLCVELEEESQGTPRQKIREELAEIGSRFDHVSGIDTFFFHSGFPVDVRHNSKIFREELTEWAKSRLQ